jgi:uncharacterized protein (DUF2235 family)
MTTPTPQPTAPKRNLVLCLDGTNNGPGTGATNVARIFDIAQKNDDQLVYYDPGVGTMGARSAITPWGHAATRVAGLIAGSGIKDNIEEAYIWLSQRYQKGDRIYVFGFSRGAYTARALTGMLRMVGLLRPGMANLAPYAVKLYAKNRKETPPNRADTASKDADSHYWRLYREFMRYYSNPDFPNPFDTSQHQVRFLGVWDTVNSVGWLNLKGQIEMATWPFTAKITNVEIARHALALDERRRPFKANRFSFDAAANSNGRYQEMWFAGVHSDVGGVFPDDHQLSDIALSWIVKEAAAAGLLVDKRNYKRHLGVGLDDDLPAERAFGKIHPNEKMWWLAGGWRNRKVLPTDALHPSVLQRIEQTTTDAKPYRPDLKREVVQV